MANPARDCYFPVHRSQHTSTTLSCGVRGAVSLTDSTVRAAAGEDRAFGVALGVSFGADSNLTLLGTNATATAGQDTTAGLQLAATTFGPRGAVSLDRCRVVASCAGPGDVVLGLAALLAVAGGVVAAGVTAWVFPMRHAKAHPILRPPLRAGPGGAGRGARIARVLREVRDGDEQWAARGGGGHGFIARWGILFVKLKPWCRWFVTLDLAATVAVAVVGGLRPTTTAGCRAGLAAILVVCLLLVVVIAAARPFLSPLRNAVLAAASLLLAAAALLALLREADGSRSRSLLAGLSMITGPGLALWRALDADPEHDPAMMAKFHLEGDDDVRVAAEKPALEGDLGDVLLLDMKPGAVGAVPAEQPHVGPRPRPIRVVRRARAAASADTPGAAPVTITAADITAQAVGSVWTATCSAIRNGVVITVPDNIYAVIPCGVRVTTTDPTVSAFAIAGMGAGSTIEFRDSSVTATFTTTSTSNGWAERHAALRVLSGASLGAGSRIYLKDAMATIVDHGTGRKGSAVLFDGGITVGDGFEFYAKASMLETTCVDDCLGFAIVGNAATGLTPSTFGSNVNIEFKSSSVEVDTTTGGTGFHIYKGVTFGDNAKFVFSGFVRVTSTSATTYQHKTIGYLISDTVTFGNNTRITPGGSVRLSGPKALCEGVTIERTISFGERSTIALSGTQIKIMNKGSVKALSIAYATFGQYSKIMVTSSTLSSITQSGMPRAFEISGTSFANNCEVLVSGSTLTASTPSWNAAALSISHTTTFGPNSMLSISRSHLTASAPLGFVAGLYFGHSVTLGNDFRLLISGGSVTATATGSVMASGILFTRTTAFLDRNTISVSGATITATGPSFSQSIALYYLVTMGARTRLTVSDCTLDAKGSGSQGVFVFSVQMADSVSINVLRSTINVNGFASSRGVRLANSRFGSSGRLAVTDCHLNVTSAESWSTGVSISSMTFGQGSRVSLTRTTVNATARTSHVDGLLISSRTSFGVDSAVYVVGCTIAATSLSASSVVGVRIGGTTLEDRSIVAIRHSTVNATAHTSHAYGFFLARTTLRPDSTISVTGSHIAARSVTANHTGAFVIKDSAGLDDRVAITVSGGSSLSATSVTSSAYGLTINSRVSIGSDTSVTVRDSRVSVMAASAASGIALFNRLKFGPRTTLRIDGATVDVATASSGATALAIWDTIILGPSSQVVVEDSTLNAHSAGSGPTGIRLYDNVTFGDSMTVTVRRSSVTSKARSSSAHAVSMMSSVQFGAAPTILFDHSRIEARTLEYSSATAVRFATNVSLGLGARVAVMHSDIVAASASTAARALQFDDRVTFAGGASIAVEDSRLNATGTTGAHIYGLAVDSDVRLNAGSSITLTRSAVHVVARQSTAAAVLLAETVVFTDDGALRITSTSLTAEVRTGPCYGLYAHTAVVFGVRGAVSLTDSTVRATAGEDRAFAVALGVSFGADSTLTLLGTNATATAGQDTTAGLQLAATTFGPRGAVSLDRCRVVASSPSQSTAVHLAAPSYDGLSLSVRRSALHFGAPRDAQQPAGALVCDGAGSWAAVALTLADVELAAVGASSPPAAEAAFVVWPPTVTGASPQRLTDVVVAAPAHRLMVPLRLPGGGSVGPDATLCLTRVRFGDGLPVRAGPPEFAVPPECAFTPTTTLKVPPSVTASSSRTVTSAPTASHTTITMTIQPPRTATRTVTLSGTHTALSTRTATVVVSTTRSVPTTPTRSRPTPSSTGTAAPTATVTVQQTHTLSPPATATQSMHPTTSLTSAATSSWSRTPTLPRSATPTPTVTRALSVTQSAAPTATANASATATAIASATRSLPGTTTASAAVSATRSILHTASRSELPTATISAPRTLTVAATATRSMPSTATLSAHATATASRALSLSATAVVTATRTSVATVTPSPTATHPCSTTASASRTLGLSTSLTAAVSASRSVPSTPTAASTATQSAARTATASARATATLTAADTATRTAAITATATAQATVTPTAAATASPNATATAAMTASRPLSSTASRPATPSAPATMTPGVLPTRTATPSRTGRPTTSASAAATATRTATAALTASATAARTATASLLGTVSAQRRVTVSVTPTVSSGNSSSPWAADVAIAPERGSGGAAVVRGSVATVTVTAATPARSAPEAFVVTVGGGLLVPPSWRAPRCAVASRTAVRCTAPLGALTFALALPVVLPAASTSRSVSAAVVWGPTTSPTSATATAATGFPVGAALAALTATSAAPPLNAMALGGTVALSGRRFDLLPARVLVGPFAVAVAPGSGAASFSLPAAPFPAVPGETAADLRARIVRGAASAEARHFLDATLSAGSVASIMRVANATAAGAPLPMVRFGVDLRTGEVVVHPTAPAPGAGPLVPGIVGQAAVRAAGTALLDPVAGTTAVPVFVSVGPWSNGTCVALCNPGTVVTLSGAALGGPSPATSVGVRDRLMVRDVRSGEVLGEVVWFVYRGVLPPEGGVGSGRNTSAPVMVTVADPVALIVLNATTRYVVADIVPSATDAPGYNATLHLERGSEPVVENVTLVLYTDLVGTGASFAVHSDSAACTHHPRNYSFTCAAAALRGRWSVPLYIRGVPPFFWGPVVVRAHIRSANAAWQQYRLRFTRGATGPVLLTPAPAAGPAAGSGGGGQASGAHNESSAGSPPAGASGAAAPGGSSGSGAAPPATPAPTTPLSVTRRMAGVFNLAGACGGAPNVALITALGFLAVIVARVVATVVQRRRIEPQSIATRNVAPSTALSRVHLWWALVWPEHHYAGVPHAVTAATHVLSLLAAVAVLLHNYRAIAAGSGVALVLLACLAAVFGGAVQPLLVVLFRVYRVQDKRRDHAVPLTQRLPQDLQVFGVPRKRFIGVTDDTVSNLNDLEFSKAAFGQGAGPHDTPPHTPRSSEGGSRDTPSGGTHSAARHLRKFNPRTCVVVDCRRYAALAYAVNAAAAVLFFGVAYYFTAPWCPGDYGLFWAVLGVALACDAAVVQPLQVGLTALGRWVTAEADEAPVHDVVPIHAQWCYVGAVCQTRSDALALPTPSTSLLTGSLTGSRSGSVPRSRRTLSAASSAGLASGACDAPCGAVRDLSSAIDLVDSVPSEVSSDLRASDGDDDSAE